MPLLSHLSQSSLLKLGLKGLPQVSHLSSGSNNSSHTSHVSRCESGSNGKPQISHSLSVSIFLSLSSILTECISQTKFVQSMAICSQNYRLVRQQIKVKGVAPIGRPRLRSLRILFSQLRSICYHAGHADLPCAMIRRWFVGYDR